MAIKFLSGQTITGNITLSGDITAATFNSLAINSTGTNNVANQIVRTEANGYANFGWINSVSGNHTGSITRITASNDAYLRYVTPAQFRTGVTDGYYASAGTVDGVTSVATGNGLSGGTITSTGTLTMSGSYTGDFTVTGNLDVTNTSTATIKVGTTGVADASVDIRGYDAGVHIGDATNGLRWAIWNDGPSTSSSLKFGSYALGTWYADGSQVVTMKSDGKVGIGTTSPGAQLHNYSTAATNVFITGYGTAAQNNWGAQNCMFVGADNGLLISKANADNNTNRIFNFYNDANGNAQFYMHASAATAAVKIQASGNSYFNGGNVGIGATSPNEKLVLRETSNTATTTLKVEGGSYGFELSKTSQSADYVHLKPRGSSISVLRVMPNATNSDSYVEVWGSDYDNDTVNWNRAYMHLSASTGNFHIKTSTNGNRPVGKLILGTQNTSDAITILDNGNVGFSDTSPNLKLTVNGAIQRKNKRGNTGKHSVGHYDRGEAVWELDPTMSSQEIADLFGGTTSTVYWDQTSGQSSLAPGGWCLYLAGGVYVGGVYNSGFPYLPVETDSPTQADYYMECYIQNVGTSQTHYMGSNEFNEGFTSLGGHPGSYGYWVMSNTDPGTSWTKVSGYIGGFSASTIGTFENGTKYWTPQALFNYGAGSGTRACRISGWKVYKVYQKGNRKLAGTLDVNSNINSETGYVRKSGVTSGGYIELGSLPGYGANAYQSLTSGGTIHFANNGKYCAYFEGANTYFGILNSSLQTQVKFNTNGVSFINGGNVGIGTTTPGSILDVVDTSGTTTLTLGRSGEIPEIKAGGTNTDLRLSAVGPGGYLDLQTNGSSRMLIQAGGNVGIGVTGPTRKLQIEGGASYPLSVNSTQRYLQEFKRSGVSEWWIAVDNGSFILHENGVGDKITVASGGTLTAAGDLVAYSDERLKSNIKTLDGSKVLKMRGVSFEKEGKKGSGVIAQELEKVAPELVHNESEYKGVAYGNLTGYLIEAIKEQQKQIEDLQAQIKNISNTN